MSFIFQIRVTKFDLHCKRCTYKEQINTDLNKPIYFSSLKSMVILKLKFEHISVFVYV